jgi:hypothetical protein
VPEDYWKRLGILGKAILIQILRPESSNGGAGRSSLGLEKGERGGMARKGPIQIVRSLERFVARRPGFCLAAALSVGIALGWWMKRQ